MGVDFLWLTRLKSGSSDARKSAKQRRIGRNEEQRVKNGTECDPAKWTISARG